jgi:hypothetical protein
VRARRLLTVELKGESDKACLALVLSSSFRSPPRRSPSRRCSLLRLLVNVLDWTFPIVLQGARIPLFLTRIVGDVLAAGLSALVWFVPLSTTRRRELQAMIASGWARLRKRISYRAFEEALHHAFERDMSFVFRACRDLSPRSALLVICAAAAWFPITFGSSTVMHAFLLANASTLPAWMQIFHFPVAPMAKSKILVLPVYPAAWPQAKRHWFVIRVQDVLRTFAKTAAGHASARSGSASSRACCRRRHRGRCASSTSLRAFDDGPSCSLRSRSAGTLEEAVTAVAATGI